MQRISLFVVVLLALACANTKPNPEIERVKRSYNAALEDPLIDVKNSLQLLEAEKDIQAAEQANRDRDETLVAHYTYLADTRIRIAHLTAETQAANRKARELAQQRPSLRLEARTAEADVATATALKYEAQARELDELEARQTERGDVLALGGVHFDFNQTELKPEATRKLSRLAGFLIANPNRDVLVEGYADAIGPESANETVSRERAEAVERYLVANGVNPARITTRWHGSLGPVEANSSADGRTMNRRAQVTVLPPNVAAPPPAP